MKIEDLTWKELEEQIKNNPIFILPIGSIEQHGSHSTLGTDYVIPKYLCEQIENIENVISLPAIPYGVCPYHKGFPGSFDIGYNTLFNIIYKIIETIKNDGAKKLIIINGHGGNTAAIEDAGTILSENMNIIVIDWWNLAGNLNPIYKGGHGDKQETSAVMAIKESSVKLNLLKKQKMKHISENIKFSDSINANFQNGSIKILKNVKEIVEDGWVGNLDPSESNVEFGKQMLNDVTNYLIDFIEEFKKIN